MKRRLLTFFTAMTVIAGGVMPVYAEGLNRIPPATTANVIDTERKGSITLYKYESEDGKSVKSTGQETGIEGQSSIPVSGCEFSYIKVANIVQVTEQNTGTTGTYYQTDPYFVQLLNEIIRAGYTNADNSGVTDNTKFDKVQPTPNVDQNQTSPAQETASKRGATPHADDKVTGSQNNLPGQKDISMLLRPAQSADGNGYLTKDGVAHESTNIGAACYTYHSGDEDYVYASDDLDEAMVNAQRVDNLEPIKINGVEYKGTGEEMINMFVKENRGDNADYAEHDQTMSYESAGNEDAREPGVMQNTDSNGRTMVGSLDLGLYVVAETKTPDHVYDGYNAYDPNSANPSANTADPSQRAVNNDGVDNDLNEDPHHEDANIPNQDTGVNNTPAEPHGTDDGYRITNDDTDGPMADDGTVGNYDHTDDAGNSNYFEDAPGGASNTGHNRGMVTYGDPNLENNKEANGDRHNDGTEVTVTPCSPFFVSVPMTNITAIGSQDAGSVWQYDITAYPKNSRFYLRKDILADYNDTEDGETTNAWRRGLTMQTDRNVGDKVHFVVTSEIPAMLSETLPDRDKTGDDDNKSEKRKSYTEYTVEDSMSKGLTLLDNSVRVTLAPQEYSFAGENGIMERNPVDGTITPKAGLEDAGVVCLTPGDDYLTEDADYTFSTGQPVEAREAGGENANLKGEHAFVIQLTKHGLERINAYDKDYRMYIDYDTVINNMAVCNDTGRVKMEVNQPDVYLDFDTTSRQHYTGNNVYVYSYEIDLTKELSQDNNADDPQTYKDVKFSVRALKKDHTAASAEGKAGYYGDTKDQTFTQGNNVIELQDTDANSDDFEDLYWVEEGENTGIYHLYDEVEAQVEAGQITEANLKDANVYDQFNTVGKDGKGTASIVDHKSYTNDAQGVDLYLSDNSRYTMTGDTVAEKKANAIAAGAKSFVTPNPESGKLILKGLDAREYVITEEETEPGFNLLKDRIYVKLNKNDAENGALDTASIWTEDDSDSSSFLHKLTSSPDSTTRANFTNQGYFDTKGTNDATEYSGSIVGNGTILPVMSQDVVSYNDGSVMDVSNVPTADRDLVNVDTNRQDEADDNASKLFGSEATRKAAGDDAYKTEQASNEDNAQDLNANGAQTAATANAGAGKNAQVLTGLQYGVFSFVVKNNSVPMLLKTGGSGWTAVTVVGVLLGVSGAILIVSDRKKKKAGVNPQA